jgi:hypothetical protein
LLAYACSLFWSAMGGLFYVGLKERRRLAEVTESSRRAPTRY